MLNLNFPFYWICLLCSWRDKSSYRSNAWVRCASGNVYISNGVSRTRGWILVFYYGAHFPLFCPASKLRISPSAILLQILLSCNLCSKFSTFCLRLNLLALSYLPNFLPACGCTVNAQFAKHLSLLARNKVLQEEAQGAGGGTVFNMNFQVAPSSG